MKNESEEHSEPQGMIFKRTDGQEFCGFGMYAALSYDAGKTWPVTDRHFDFPSYNNIPNDG